jgi:two-component system, OmpR family, phosphate regulon sensor histidine kinase PhoR
VPHEELLPVLNGLAACIFVIDGDRQIIQINEAGAELFGNGLVGVDFVQAVRDPKCLKAINKVLDGRKKSEVVITLHNPVRTTYRVKVTRFGSKNGSDPQEYARAIVSLENISHIREAEQMRVEFVANVSHELRSPLTALNGFIETLKGAAKNDQQARERFLEIMELEAKRMDRLIGDLLSLSKVEADQHVRPDAQVDIAATLNQVLTILSPQADQENITLVLNIAPGIKTSVFGDEDQLLQVFLNLVENAIKYCGGDGEVTIAVEEHSRAPGIRGSAISVEVKDQGAGIEPEHLPRLTERFYRVDKGRSREKGGTGLGLAIVKHIIARHRGRLQIKSKLGKGSTFTVFLPL